MKWSLRLSVRTRGFHPRKGGSIPPGTTKWSISVAVNTSPCHGEDHGFESRMLRQNIHLNRCVKKFYSIKLKQFMENIPPKLAEQMLLDESKLIKYLWRQKALEFRHTKRKNRLDLYADEKYLMLGRMKYPDIFGPKGRMGFMELYISYQINKKLRLAKGST